MSSGALPPRVGRYEVRTELGWGSTGRVFLAVDPTVDRRVAVKLMSPRETLSAADEAELRERFLLEARAAGRLRHPNVVLVWDAGIDADTLRPYLAMEYVDGLGLERLLARDRALEPDLVVAIGVQVARALNHAHRQGVVHRDIKPANILLARDGLAKIGDFGIARVEGLALTRTGIVLGSPMYMSPEQVQEHVLDGRSDLFSLAAVLFEATSGAPPFPGSNLAAVTWRIVWGEPDLEAAERIPPALRKVLLGALSRDAADRPDRGEEFAAALTNAVTLPKDDPDGQQLVREAVERVAGPVNTVLETAATTRLNAPPAPRWSRRLPVLAASLALCVLVAIALLSVERAPRSNPSAHLDSAMLPDAASNVADSASQNPVTDPLSERKGEPTDGPTDEMQPQSQPVPREGDAQIAARSEGGQRTSIGAPTNRPGSPVGRTTGAATAFPPPPLDITRPFTQDLARLEVALRLRLREAHLSVWIDGELAWSEPTAGPRNIFSRMAGRDVIARMTVEPGEHSIEARLTGQSMDVDARTILIANFAPGSARRLRLTLNPYTDRLDWKWAGEPD